MGGKLRNRAGPVEQVEGFELRRKDGDFGKNAALT